MKILFHVGHPGHVHLFKNVARKLDRDHEILISAVDKEMTIYLLERYGLNYLLVGKNQNGLFNKFKEMFYIEKRLYNLSNSFKPDIMIGVANLYLAHVGKLLDIPTLIMDDTEHSKLEILLYRFFANKILTPSCFGKNLGSSQINYSGYHELAYLHPNTFTPRAETLEKLNLETNSKYFLIRFVSWAANHDRGYRGLSNNSKIKLVRFLNKFGKVYISSELPLPKELEKFKIKVSPTEIHDIIYFANLVITEGATIASESAILGTPVIYINNLRLGYLQEQEKKYKLVHNFKSGENLINLAKTFITNEEISDNCRANAKKLISDNIDLTSFLYSNIVEN